MSITLSASSPNASGITRPVSVIHSTERPAAPWDFATSAPDKNIRNSSPNSDTAPRMLADTP